jgi:hypothetical protein
MPDAIEPNGAGSSDTLLPVLVSDQDYWNRDQTEEGRNDQALFNQFECLGERERRQA